MCVRESEGACVHVRVSVRARVSVRVSACVCACVHESECVCVHARVHVSVRVRACARSPGITAVRCFPCFPDAPTCDREHGHGLKLPTLPNGLLCLARVL